MIDIEKQEIIDGNKLIAEFWGSKELIYEVGTAYWKFNDEWYGIFNDNMLGSNWVCGNFQFHKSYNWLIPIIDKIENTDVSDQHYKWECFDGERSNFMCFKFDTECKYDGYSSSVWMELQLDPIERVAGDYRKSYPTRIESMWNTVVEFIKYYKETYE